ncbi:hypothetical protein LTR29_008975 [Friedmanniomyces endolithicus]|nr:hypothetical protein LTR29_008975 [Friedmanniomyces endolithicus]
MDVLADFAEGVAVVDAILLDVELLLDVTGLIDELLLDAPAAFEEEEGVAETVLRDVELTLAVTG